MSEEEEVTLPDGTKVKRQPDGTNWTDGKSVVIFADVGEVVVDVVTEDDPRLQDLGGESS